MATPYPTLSRPPSSVSWGLRDNTEVHSSPFNQTVQTLYRPGSRWVASVMYEELEKEDASLLEVFLAGLKGRAGRFDLPDYARLIPRGLGTGSPILLVASNPGDTILSTSGWPVSTSNLLLKADRIELGDNFMMTLIDVASDVSGEAFITVEPALTMAVPILTALTIHTPTCRMMLDSNSIDWRISPPNLSSVRFDCTESHT